jgi:hypothetical protein
MNSLSSTSNRPKHVLPPPFSPRIQPQSRFFPFFIPLLTPCRTPLSRFFFSDRQSTSSARRQTPPSPPLHPVQLQSRFCRPSSHPLLLHPVLQLEAERNASILASVGQHQVPNSHNYSRFSVCNDLSASRAAPPTFCFSTHSARYLQRCRIRRRSCSSS